MRARRHSRSLHRRQRRRGAGVLGSRTERRHAVEQRHHSEEWRTIPSTGRDIRLLVMRPVASARPPEQTPGILWIHGGGHIFGLYRFIMLARARSLVDKFGAVVVVPAYRCALESPFPADLEDCYAALLYLKAHAAELGVNDSQLMVGGESAGGGLTVATCLLARDTGDVDIAFQMPLYPMLDDRDTPSSRDNHAPVWNTRSNHRAWRLYLRGIRPASAPAYAAPARETNYAGLPPAYSCVGDIEPFYCETATYIENLRRAGIEAHLDVYPQWFHAYDMLLPFTAKAKLAIARFEERYRYAAAHYFAPQKR
ncbi:alpha/beta hydrolase [Parvibacter caecicola]|uniref:Alpha/beta hydrolase n=1 Tax=Parvibacter caecicola TaxID=747645 RepID=A0A4T9TBP1_9ACTN|nr:alpha/beta hydrolase [Parvibacter caecicola]